MFARMGTSSSGEFVRDAQSTLSMTWFLGFAEKIVDKMRFTALRRESVFARMGTSSSEAFARNAQPILSTTPP